MDSPLSTKPIRSVLKWQAIATAATAVVAGLWAGPHGALSAVLGGVVNISACVVYAMVMGLAKPASAGGTVVALFRALHSGVSFENAFQAQSGMRFQDFDAMVTR